MVCGAIKLEELHVEPLTPLLPMLPGFGITGRPYQIAYCLRALKEGLDALQEFWYVTQFKHESALTQLVKAGSGSHQRCEQGKHHHR
jgi:hypothetical protein